MFDKIKDIFNAKISIYTVVLILMSILVLSISIPIYRDYKENIEPFKKESFEWVQKDKDGKIIERGMLRKGQKDGYWKEYRSKGSYKMGRKLGKWYYYNTEGNLAFIDDMDEIGKKYNVFIRDAIGDPIGISYIIHSTESIKVEEGYDKMSHELGFLSVNVHTQKIDIQIDYDEDRNIININEFYPKKNSKNYNIVSISKRTNPQSVLYIFTEGVKAVEKYDKGILQYLDITIPSKKVQITIVYDKDRHIIDVKYNKNKSNKTSALTKSKKMPIKNNGIKEY